MPFFVVVVVVVVVGVVVVVVGVYDRENQPLYHLIYVVKCHIPLTLLVDRLEGKENGSAYKSCISMCVVE
jgi:hypothetical protein